MVATLIVSVLEKTSKGRKSKRKNGREING
jgi:hypothetical protein